MKENQEMVVKNAPFANSPLAVFVDRRNLELSAKKSQRDIALEAGFRHANMRSMIKSEMTKLAIDGEPALVRVLNCDPRHLMLLALDQAGLKTGAMG